MNTIVVEIVDKFSGLVLDPIIALLFSAGILLFFIGLAEFMWDPNNTSRRKIGKMHIIYGIAGVLIMVSVWGIMGMVLSVIGVDCSGLSSGRPCQ